MIKITYVKPLPDYILLVGFSINEFKYFDIKPLFKKLLPFKSLIQVNGLYEQVKIDSFGCGIIWNDDLDLSANGLYEQGTLCSHPTSI